MRRTLLTVVALSAALVGTASSAQTCGSTLSCSNYGNGYAVTSSAGVGFYASSSADNAIYGSTSNANSSCIYGNTQYGFGVAADTSGTDRSAILGRSHGIRGRGVYALTDNSDAYNAAFALYAEVPTSRSSFDYAGYFKGQVLVGGSAVVVGMLSKGGGSFQIDHPLDPDNKFLYHSFVESPDMKNVYDGIALLDSSGEAWVSLPGYFEALNRDFRYQLTPIGQQASLYVSSEISNNRFRIAGGLPGMRVSWQVTGIRQDAFAKAHPIIPEVNKSGNERGYFLHPAELGKPIAKSLVELKGPRPGAVP